MLRHKYRPGQTVRFIESPLRRSHLAMPEGSFRIIALMPEYLGNYQYRVESTRDSHHRVAMENEITSL